MVGEENLVNLAQFGALGAFTVYLIVENRRQRDESAAQGERHVVALENNTRALATFVEGTRGCPRRRS